MEQQRLNRAALDEIRGLQQPPDNFRELSVMPRQEDVCTDMEPFLRPNIVEGTYPDIDSYLDIQFRLLREDFFDPLRSGLLRYKDDLRKNKNKQPSRIDNVRFYYGVKILDYKDGSGRNWKNNQYILEFSVKGLERIQWESSKRLLNGSLVCLSSDNFSSFFLFTISERTTQLLSRGQIVVTLEESTTFSTKLKKNVYVMAESSVYFEAYRSILLTLQKINPNRFPMKEYILGESFDVKSPRYLRDRVNLTY